MARKSIKRNQYQENNDSWKGNDAGYKAFHVRVKIARGIAKTYGCSNCGLNDKNKRYEWSNLTGDYNNIWDYKSMCVKCHRAYDRKRKDVDKNA